MRFWHCAFLFTLPLLWSGYTYATATHSGIEPKQDALTAQSNVGSRAAPPIGDGKPMRLAQKAPKAPSVPRTTGNPALAPLKWVGLLQGVAKAGEYRCTAQFIAPRIILTAAHCIQDNQTGEWYDQTKMMFWLQYQNRSASRGYNIVCAARLNGWVPKIPANASEDETFIAFQEAYQYDFAMALVEGESVTGSFSTVALDAGEKLGQFKGATAVGYPAALAEGEIIQQDDGFLGVRYYPENVLAFWHLNDDMTQGSSGGVWISNFNLTEGRGSNVIVGLTSFHYPWWPRTTFGPYLKSKEWDALRSYVSRGCPQQ